MSLTLISSPGEDHELTAWEISQKLKGLYGSRGRCERTKEFRPIGYWLHVVFILAMDAERPVLVPHPMQDGPAQLEWWQSGHTLTGFGSSMLQGEAVDRAFACARRGDLAQHGLTVWRDRLTSRVLVFERSPRDPDENYKPTGRLLTRESFAALVRQ